MFYSLHRVIGDVSYIYRDGKQKYHPIAGPFEETNKDNKDLFLICSANKSSYETTDFASFPRSWRIGGSSGRLVGLISPILVPVRLRVRSYGQKPWGGRFVCVYGINLKVDLLIVV